MKLDRVYIPDTLTHDQERVIAQVSERLLSYGWKKDFVTQWWQTPSRNLNNHCPLEAIVADKFDLVHMELDKTVRLHEANLKEIEDAKKFVIETIREGNESVDGGDESEGVGEVR